MITQVKKYTLTIDDTFRGESQIWHTDSLIEAQNKAKRLVRVMESANAVITVSTTGEVVDYLDKEMGNVA